VLVGLSRGVELCSGDSCGSASGLTIPVNEGGGDTSGREIGCSGCGRTAA
jgi:hypothetical protein